jgi:hypothetical protein
LSKIILGGEGGEFLDKSFFCEKKRKKKVEREKYKTVNLPAEES